MQADAEPLAPGDAMSLSDSALRAVTGSRSDVVARLATGPRFDSRTRLLLEGPIVGTLLRLATPNVLVMFMQASVGLIETYFVAKLGTDALAGVALVFPVLMLMQMMSAGAVGDGISSAIARALGAGRRADADALVLHALAIAVSFGLVFMLAVLGGGRWLYGALGGSGASLAAALTYSQVVFSGAILIWMFNALANVIRGTGNMTVPATVTSVGAAALIPLSPGLIFGWGPLPRLGVAGGAVAHAWLSLFDTDPAMLDAGSRYLHAVGPCYGLFGLGMALYFASQGAGRLAGAALERRPVPGLPRPECGACGLRPHQRGSGREGRLVRSSRLAADAHGARA